MSDVAVKETVSGSRLKARKQVGAVEISVEVLIFLLYKAFSAMRAYTPDHPLFQNSLQNLYRTFDEFFDAYDQLHLQLTESEIVFQGESVYREDEKRSSLIFMLFNDGIREIRFEKGLTHEEIRGFLGALKSNAALPQQERDIVSLFWSRDFDHIKYYAVDEIPDQEIENVNNAISDLESHESVFDKPDETEATSKRQSDIEKCLADIDLKESTLNSAILSQLKAFKDEEIEILLETLRDSKFFNAEQELVDIIFDVLRLEDDEDRYLPIFRLLEEYSDELLSRCVFAPVNRIVAALGTFSSEQKERSSLKSQRVEDLARKYSDEEKINILRIGLNSQRPFQSDSLYSYIAALRPAAIGPICSLLDELEDPKVRSIICQGLETLAQDQASRLIRPIESASEREARDLVAVLGKLGDENVPELLKACMKNTFKTVRGEAVQALRNVGNAKAKKVLMECLGDKDPDISSAAAESLESIADGDDVKPLCDIVRKKTFHARSYREKKALLSILGNVESEECLQILEVLLKKKVVLLRRRYDETRVCAALALGPKHSDAAYDILDKFSRDSSYHIKSACTLALQAAR